MSSLENNGQDVRLITSRQVCAMFGEISLVTLWRWCRDDGMGFPRPVKIASRNYWDPRDLSSWAEARASEQASGSVVEEPAAA